MRRTVAVALVAVGLTGAGLAGVALAGTGFAGVALADGERTGVALTDARSAGAALAGTERAGAALAGTERAGAALAGTERAGAALAGTERAGAAFGDDSAGGAVGEHGTRVDGGSAELVAVGDDRLWPYVAPVRSFDRRASSINVVVRTDPATVRRYLAGEGAWNRTDDGMADDSRVADAANESVVADEHVPWREAPGAPRYTYVAGEGWLAERYQLDRGTYFGSRSHLRAYAPSEGDWTAVQAHNEHWDWFTITHTVDSVERAQRRVETGFLGTSRFTVRQVNYDNGDTYDADRWATVVALAVAPLVARRRLRGVLTARNANRVALAGMLAALPLVVRFGGVLFERHLPWLSADAVVAVWYPVLVAGVPVAAATLGRRLPATEAGGLAGLGVGVGIVADYAYLGIGVLPIPVGVHRAGAVAAIALLAAGAASRNDAGDAQWPPALRVGAALWVAVVVAGHLV